MEKKSHEGMGFYEKISHTTPDQEMVGQKNIELAKLYADDLRSNHISFEILEYMNPSSSPEAALKYLETLEVSLEEAFQNEHRRLEIILETKEKIRELLNPKSITEKVQQILSQLNRKIHSISTNKGKSIQALSILMAQVEMEANTLRVVAELLAQDLMNLNQTLQFTVPQKEVTYTVSQHDKGSVQISCYHQRGNYNFRNKRVEDYSDWFPGEKKGFYATDYFLTYKKSISEYVSDAGIITFLYYFGEFAKKLELDKKTTQKKSEKKFFQD